MRGIPEEQYSRLPSEVTESMELEAMQCRSQKVTQPRTHALARYLCWHHLLGAFGLAAIFLLVARELLYDSNNLSTKRLEVASRITLDRQQPLRANGSLPDTVLHDLSLSYDACDAYFPLHADEARMTGDWARSTGGVSLADVEHKEEEWEGARVLIKDGRMYVKSYKPSWESRVFATLQSLHEAVLTAPETMPDVEFTMSLSDVASSEKATFGLARRHDEPVWLLADFGFFAWPEPGIGSYAKFLKDVERVNAEVPWQSKISKLFWRGRVISDARRQLVDISHANSRWGDAREISWDKSDRGVSMADHARYQYVAMTEGTDSYSGRLKYLLSGRNVVVSHPLRWNQPFHRALDWREGSPTQNIVITEGPGFQGLEATMQKLLADPARSRRIADNAYETFHRSPAGVHCWWRTVLREYASALTFDPQLDDRARDIESVLLMQKADFRRRRTKRRQSLEK